MLLIVLCVGVEIQYPAYTSCLPTSRNIPAAPQIVNVTVSQSVNHALIKNRILVPRDRSSSYYFSITTLHCPKKDGVLTWDINIFCLFGIFIKQSCYVQSFYLALAQHCEGICQRVNLNHRVFPLQVGSVLTY